MRTLLIGLALALGAETAALACSCIPPSAPAESRGFAQEAVRGAVAIVEGQALTAYRPGGRGERVRVHRRLWGEAPTEFRIERGDFASSASCDILLVRGQRKVLILYPATDRRQRGRQFRIQGLCSDFLVSDEVHLAVTLQEARRR